MLHDVTSADQLFQIQVRSKAPAAAKLSVSADGDLTLFSILK